jgi:hypothetical protein
MTMNDSRNVPTDAMMDRMYAEMVREALVTDIEYIAGQLAQAEQAIVSRRRARALDCVQRAIDKLNSSIASLEPALYFAA